jgi:hypothetical protein
MLTHVALGTAGGGAAIGSAPTARAHSGDRGAARGAPGSLTVVSNRVFASPSHAAVNLSDATRRGSDGVPQPSYPDIYFAVHDYEDVFQASVRLPCFLLSSRIVAAGYKGSSLRFPASALAPQVLAAMAHAKESC